MSKLNKKNITIGLVISLVVVAISLNTLQHEGPEVDNDSKTDTTILNSNNTNINEIDISKSGEETKEYLKIDTKKIKDALVGDYKLQTAYTSQSVDDYMMYWGSSYRYGGGLKFNKDDTFEFTLGAYADMFDRSGTYIVDTDNNKITYVFYNGTIEYGTFDYSNGKINEVLYVDISYVGDNESDKLMVKLIPNEI